MPTLVDLCDISRLDHFNIAAYDLPTRCPTLNPSSYLIGSKDLLPDGWLYIPSGARFAPAKTHDLARPHIAIIILTM